MSDEVVQKLIAACEAAEDVLDEIRADAEHGPWHASMSDNDRDALTLVKDALKAARAGCKQ